VIPAQSSQCTAGIIDPRYSNAGQWRPVGLPSGAFKMEAAKIYFIIFGLLTIAGGIFAYMKVGSVPSIVAGSISGVLLLVAAFLLPQCRAAGLATALIVSVVLAAYFASKYLSTGAVMPAGMMSVLSLIGIIAAIIAWVRK
jgi:uncharacterized membrane protein (UPF0136 family)